MAQWYIGSVKLSYWGTMASSVICLSLFVFFGCFCKGNHVLCCPLVPCSLREDRKVQKIEQRKKGAPRATRAPEQGPHTFLIQKGTNCWHRRERQRATESDRERKWAKAGQCIPLFISMFPLIIIPTFYFSLTSCIFFFDCINFEPKDKKKKNRGAKVQRVRSTSMGLHAMGPHAFLSILFFFYFLDPFFSFPWFFLQSLFLQNQGTRNKEQGKGTSQLTLDPSRKKVLVYFSFILFFLVAIVFPVLFWNWTNHHW